MSEEIRGTTRLDPGLPTGVLLSGMGGPDGPDAVGPFLRNLFADPAILPLPRLLARPLGGLIARSRTEAVRKRYVSMGLGGASPQLGWTRRQGEAIEKRLAERGIVACVEPAMRYWRPYPEEALIRLRERGAQQYIILPTYPQYSAATTGSIAGAIKRSFAQLCGGRLLLEIRDWHLLSGYLDALIGLAGTQLAEWAEAEIAPERCALLFAAHSLPKRFITRGDPYEDQTRESVNAAHALLRERFPSPDWLARVRGGREYLLGFQSRVGPIKWIGPNILDQLREMAGDGVTHLFVQPVSFSCEHIETKHELDREYAALAEKLGVECFERGPALNLNQEWLESLSGLLAGHIGERRRVEHA